MLELHVLRSGDKGSCAAVRVAGEQEFLCVDCGISGATFADACAEAGLVPFKVQAFLITHCHSNQVKGLKSTLAWLCKRGVVPTVYVEPGVLAASPALQELQGTCDMREFHTRQPFQVGDVLVRPFRTFHNNEDKGSCYNFRFETRFRQDDGSAAGDASVSPQAGTDGAAPAVAGDPALSSEAGDDTSDSIVMLSDVGILSREAQGELPHARLLAIETNYDTELLEAAAQTNAQVRFAVDTRGNFSNAQAATVVQTYAWPGLKDVVAMYLSRQYNTAERATAVLEAALAQTGCTAHVACSSPDEAVSVLPEGEGGSAPQTGSAAAVSGAAAEVGVAEAPVLSDVPAPVGVCEGGSVCDDVADQCRTECPAPPDSASEDFPPGFYMPAYEDIFTVGQAAEAGFVNAEGLVAAWEKEGCLAHGTPLGPGEALSALEAAGLLDPRDSMPTEQGQKLGVWAEYVEEPPTSEAILKPVFLRVAAPFLWEAACLCLRR